MHQAVKLSLFRASHRGLVLEQCFEAVESSVEAGTIVEKSYVLLRSAFKVFSFVELVIFCYYVFSIILVFDVKKWHQMSTADSHVTVAV